MPYSPPSYSNCPTKSSPFAQSDRIESCSDFRPRSRHLSPTLFPITIEKEKGAPCSAPIGLLLVVALEVVVTEQAPQRIERDREEIKEDEASGSIPITALIMCLQDPSTSIPFGIGTEISMVYLRPTKSK